MKSMSWSMASRIMRLSRSERAGRSMCSPGTFTLLCAPSVPSLSTRAVSVSPSLPTTFMASAPSSKSTSSPTFTSLAKLVHETHTWSWVVSVSGWPLMATCSSVLYAMGSLTPVVLTSGPLVSISRARCGVTALVLRMILRMPSGVAWAVFILTTFMPAKNKWRRKSCSQCWSLMVHTIFVCFMLYPLLCYCKGTKKMRNSRPFPFVFTD